MKSTNPQQQLVPADTCDRQGGEQVPERLIPAEVEALETALFFAKEIEERAARRGDNATFWRAERIQRVIESFISDRCRASTGGNEKLSDGLGKTL